MTEFTEADVSITDAGKRYELWGDIIDKPRGVDA